MTSSWATVRTSAYVCNTKKRWGAWGASASDGESERARARSGAREGRNVEYCRATCCHNADIPSLWVVEKAGDDSTVACG